MNLYVADLHFGHKGVAYFATHFENNMIEYVENDLARIYCGNKNVN